ncbi:hypothetical protein DIPPA_16306 [Diplonema papillatum]|nr:hypothetical protein DIPPA_16306 [Diplonema papillatum]
MAPAQPCLRLACLLGCALAASGSHGFYAVKGPTTDASQPGDGFVWEPGYPILPQTSETLYFTVTSDAVRSIEAILHVANGRETVFNLSIRSSNSRITSADPHITGAAGCSWKEDCGNQRDFNYALPTFIDPQSIYRNRITLRVESLLFRGPLTGNWTVVITNNLHHGANNAFIKLEVRQKTTTSRDALPLVFFLAFATVVLLIVSFDCLVWLKGASIKRGTDSSEGTPARPAAVSVLLTAISGQSLLSGINSTVREWYTTLDDSGAPDDAADGEKKCRFCRKGEEDGRPLVRPCECKGDATWAHAACLEQWKASAAHENADVCPECNEPYRKVGTRNQTLARAKVAVCAVASLIIRPILSWCLLLAVGYAFKLVAGLLTNNLDRITWSADLYHHFVACAVLIAFAMHEDMLGGLLASLVPSRRLRALIVAVSVLFEVVAGYFLRFLFYLVDGTVWSWDIHYGCGLLLVGLYYLAMRDTVETAYGTWKVSHQVERVVELSDEGDVDKEVEMTEIPPAAPADRAVEPEDAQEAEEPRDGEPSAALLRRPPHQLVEAEETFQPADDCLPSARPDQAPATSHPSPPSPPTSRPATPLSPPDGTTREPS